MSIGFYDKVQKNALGLLFYRKTQYISMSIGFYDKVQKTHWACRFEQHLLFYRKTPCISMSIGFYDKVQKNALGLISIAKHHAFRWALVFTIKFKKTHWVCRFEQHLFFYCKTPCISMSIGFYDKVQKNALGLIFYRKTSWLQRVYSKEMWQLYRKELSL